MPGRKELEENIDAVETIESVTDVYQKIATMRMNQVREGVIRTREFLDGVAAVYNHAKTAYLLELEEGAWVKQDKKWEEASFIKRNNKTVLVLLSANEHLYGSVLVDVWRKFIEDYKKTKNDALIIGNYAKPLMRLEKKESDVAYLDLDDDKPTQEQMQKIVDHIKQYERVYVYYGKMATILRQEVTITQISGGVDLKKKSEGASRYLFEPSPQEILSFFEGEIIGALFNQIVFEHQLARFASRMVAMYSATDNAKDVLKGLKDELRAFRKQLAQTKQLEIFAGMSGWQG